MGRSLRAHGGIRKSCALLDMCAKISKSCGEIRRSRAGNTNYGRKSEQRLLSKLIYTLSEDLRNVSETLLTPVERNSATEEQEACGALLEKCVMSAEQSFFVMLGRYFGELEEKYMYEGGNNSSGGEERERERERLFSRVPNALLIGLVARLEGNTRNGSADTGTERGGRRRRVRIMSEDVLDHNDAQSFVEEEDDDDIPVEDEDDEDDEDEDGDGHERDEEADLEEASSDENENENENDCECEENDVRENGAQFAGPNINNSITDGANPLLRETAPVIRPQNAIDSISSNAPVNNES